MPSVLSRFSMIIWSLLLNDEFAALDDGLAVRRESCIEEGEPGEEARSQRAARLPVLTDVNADHTGAVAVVGDVIDAGDRAQFRVGTDVDLADHILVAG